MTTAEIIAMAPDKMTGMRSQMRPDQPPAIVRAPIVPMVPTPKMVATMPATDVLAAASLIVLLAIASAWIDSKIPRKPTPRILLTSTAKIQMR